MLILFTALASAHLPSITVDEAGSWQSPWDIEDIDHSIVVYDTVTCEAEQFWMDFDASQGERIWVQLGVPVIDRLEDYRPNIAVLAPGLPELQLPFDMPPGVGGVVFDTAGLDEVGSFYEPFSQTESWVLVEEWVDLPDEGTGYIVAWHPERLTGKQWVAVGTVEDFSGGIDVTMDEVRTFHENPGYEPDPVPELQTCLDDDVAAEDVAEESGCTTAGGAPWLAWLVLLGIRRRVSAPGS